MERLEARAVHEREHEARLRLGASGLDHRVAQRLRRASAVRVLAFPVIAELGHRPLLALGNEDRVVAEPFGAAWFVPDPPLEDAGAAALAVRPQRDELADASRPPPLSLDPLELLQQPLDRPARSEPCGLDSRTASEAIDLDPGVLAEHKRGRLEPEGELRLRPRVLVVGRAGLGRIVVRVERLQLPAERGPQLAELAGVLRGEERLQGFQRAPRTCSLFVSASISSAAVRPVESRTCRSTLRRSPSSSNWSALTSAPACSTASSRETALAPAGKSTASRPSSGRKRIESR